VSDISSSSSPGATTHPAPLVERSEGSARPERSAGPERSTRCERPAAGAVVVTSAPVVSAVMAGAAATPGVPARPSWSRAADVPGVVPDVVATHRVVLLEGAPDRCPSVKKYRSTLEECQRHIVNWSVSWTPDQSGRMEVDAGNTQVGPRVQLVRVIRR
jgi:hypothetical protein